MYIAITLSLILDFQGIAPLVPLFIHGVMHGDDDIREHTARGLGNKISFHFLMFLTCSSRSSSKIEQPRVLEALHHSDCRVPHSCQ
jgi:hypothetical protein